MIQMKTEASPEQSIDQNHFDESKRRIISDIGTLICED